MKKNLYLDYAATAPLSDSTKDYIIQILDTFGNPSSAYSAGEKARTLISDARNAIAEFIHADADNIYFTCGGSAANTLAIRGYVMRHPMCQIFYSSATHKSIIECISCLDCTNTSIKVDRDGFLDLEHLDSLCRMSYDNKKQPFAIIDYANSEIGTIQNIKKIIEIVHGYHGILYLDCTGSISSIPLNIRKLDIDMCGFSAHKLGALKGCGVFFKKKEIELEPLVYGNQEQGIMGGTENVLGIASLYHVVKNYDYSAVSSAGRDYVLDYITEHIKDTYLIGSKTHRLPHNLYLCFQGIEGEAFMILLDMNGIQISTGSACNSRTFVPSPALLAIGINKDDLHSCIRITFSGREEKKELDYLCHTLKSCIDMLRNLNNKAGT